MSRRLTYVYGEVQTNERFKTWDMLKFIKSSTHLPWVCIGDRNIRAFRREAMCKLLDSEMRSMFVALMI